MAKTVVTKGENTGKEWTLSKGKFKIGRGQDNDLLLVEPTVSRRHASIKYKNGKYLLINFSRNGTKINGELIKSRYLKDGDKIEIGSTTILYQEEPGGIQDGSRKKLIFTFLFLAVIISAIFLVSFRFDKRGVVSLVPPMRGTYWTEKTDNPQNYFNLARRLYREREIKDENLFLAIQSWHKGLSLLEKSSRTETITLQLKKAEEELDRKIKNEMFKAYQSYHLGNLSSCRLHLERVLKLIPSPADRRYQTALAKLKVLNQK
ncbi:hypothetical protein AUJ66_08130 [Candidatus Desantisbacteria bacterium CG1_02_38_46]|uniref:FHA domain-containing protein n=3 Tax=unclassified Candidatus Desantisiibacteriota TaxID=3106372 RepID=A0A2H9PCP0_9BACT|nr:MAG: hypothetical protein AUJ66_08130 [Candidatus Desantisbacteria bacterium CG1_02_38_46]PIU51466.1 MAG: hypothetical protein COS91_04280 [Candidatus Desantisbacteria bacterium CG07_land_8_20_14_0_80_39_15]PIZ17068.1 MAG: hypothetical protein COY51_01255 [Candidatus Desantisbacteria bacterium CG_4_10_14_0_8_um_filter_39_17]